METTLNLTSRIYRQEQGKELTEEILVAFLGGGGWGLGAESLAQNILKFKVFYYYYYN